jgi:anthranilate synthase/aminodeoxychorismate synthase-like glutamine amidotransferase
MILLIDNYDSFTFNLVHLLGGLGAQTDVRRNDSLSAAEAIALRPDAIVLSPGPCAPAQAGICLDLVRAAADANIPLFGVCLGHQAIGQAFGGDIVRAPRPVHGKVDRMHHDNDETFAGLPSPFEATRYHSLTVDRATFPDSLAITAWTGDGVIMALRHRTLPIAGVQFHPESIASPSGPTIVANFLRTSGVRIGADRAAA